MIRDPSAGGNDPCPCGSGRKYKNCCLEDQGSGLPDEGPAGVFAEIRQALQGSQFSSLEELRSFSDRFMRQRNQASLGDFHGLSPERMHRILAFPLFGLLAEAIGEKGLKPTAKGNLPRNVCREAVSAHWGEEAIREDGRFVHINKSVVSLHRNTQLEETELFAWFRPPCERFLYQSSLNGRMVS